MADEGSSQIVSRRFVVGVLWKASVLFVLFNLLFAWLFPLPALGRLSAYNRVFPGRTRLPFGEDPDRSYNLSVLQLDALFASHELSGTPKQGGEYRVLMIGDSSVWGFRLKQDQTVSAALNAQSLTTIDGRRVRSYNLGYPTMSLTKDLLLLDLGRRYHPDLIIWLVTLESFPYPKQLSAPLLQYNPGSARDLIARYHLRLDVADNRFVDLTFWDRTIVGQRRDLMDLVRLQLYGPLWASTSVDHYVPETFPQRMEDLPADLTFQGIQPPKLSSDDLAFEVLEAGVRDAGDIPVLFVNQPIFVSRGLNSGLRYNAFYPRWAYDVYREYLAEHATASSWNYLDLWDALPPDSFTDSSIHYSAEAAQGVAVRLVPAILEVALRGKR